MRKQVKHYQGNKITPEVIRKISLIELIRQKEGLTTFTIENIDTLEELCDNYGVLPEQVNIILGEDWYLIYITYDSEIEIQEWLSINNVKDKLVQTMEMLNSIKNVLLEYKDNFIYSTLRHSTSYKFYRLLLNKGYINELDNDFEIDDNMPKDLISLIENRDECYNSIEEYIDSENEEELNDLPDFIYHDVTFKISDRFIKRYQKR